MKFKEFLQFAHFSDNPWLLDDDLVDDYDRWAGELDYDRWCSLAEEWHEEEGKRDALNKET